MSFDGRLMMLRGISTRKGDLLSMCSRNEKKNALVRCFKVGYRNCWISSEWVREDLRMRVWHPEDVMIQLVRNEIG